MIDIIDMKTTSLEDLKKDSMEDAPDVSVAVGEILQAVKQGGDPIVMGYTQKFDGAILNDMKVSQEEIDNAEKEVGEEFLSVLRKAAENIYAFHQKQVRQGFVMADKPGVVMGQRIIPLQKVGLYVPGGTAAYPSTVLMDAIPAKIAGVEQVVMVTPPSEDGSVHPAILAAASVAGVKDIYKVGGAQAVAALCYGTKSIPRVDKIVGPGNLYVATAKKMVYGMVDIDMIAGPSDVLVVADDTANPEYIAADMLAQAEHDVLAAAVLVSTSEGVAKKVQVELERQLENTERKEIARQSILENGRILLVESIEEGLEIANTLAPEHLELCVKDPFGALPMVKNAGSVFLGNNTPEALGDYFAGPNHTLPTAGTARFYSPLSVDDFVKKSSYLYYSEEALQEVGDDVHLFASKEGLFAHANSVKVRMKKK